MHVCLFVNVVAASEKFQVFANFLTVSYLQCFTGEKTLRLYTCIFQLIKMHCISCSNTKYNLPKCRRQRNDEKEGLWVFDLIEVGKEMCGT